MITGRKMSSRKTCYRQRVYLLADESVQLVYGNDAAPDGGKLLADQDVSEVVIVSEHIGPEPLASAETGAPI